ncbi:hypothetical protein Dsin_024708 [Dipteronia sinensis]|uniref:Reverse transcriptase zinc-binding domain-containing protein n=1 Tax=Dipteronia sinensis TaxID=43782 RepID=A0AAE0DWG6_9ROSI|nr:hypothetical protein Dsin_024708 [Dipteronia sinensis]
MAGELLPKFIGGAVGSQLCPLCKDVAESIDHLLLCCGWTWKLWSTCLNWWGISACLPKRMTDWKEEWMMLCPSTRCLRVWKVAFHAIFLDSMGAILKACQLVDSTNCPTNLSIIIESDSKSVVAWANGVGNVKYLDAILDIREIMK